MLIPAGFCWSFSCKAVSRVNLEARKNDVCTCVVVGCIVIVTNWETLVCYSLSGYKIMVQVILELHKLTCETAQIRVIWGEKLRNNERRLEIIAIRLLSHCITIHQERKYYCIGLKVRLRELNKMCTCPSHRKVGLNSASKMSFG